MVKADSGKRPNFLFIIADDLGYSDIEPFGSEIKTPALSLLAKDGVRMLNYHTASACSPTRSMILSGTDAHLGGLGCLIEYKRSELGSKRFNGKPGYEGFLNKDIAPISEILQDNGYFTVLSGKWHLGLRPEFGPSSRGFTKSFACLPGCCNHFGWEPQLEGGRTGMPFGGRPIHSEDGLAFKVIPNTNVDEDGFYSSDYYTTRFIDYLEHRDAEEMEKPFFGYLAYTATHWPCQAPKAARTLYKDAYNDGPDVLRQQRLAALRRLGIIGDEVVPHQVVAPGIPEWNDMTPDEKAKSSATMAAYAGMVHQMDVNIGRVIDYLKQKGEYDNTFIVFMSDNGAEGAAIEASPVMGSRMMEAIQKFYDNSTENIGAYNSYTWLGPRWAQASTAPSRLYKSFTSEGGILVPCIVKAPMFSAPHYVPGGFVRALSTCRDLAPTICELLDIKLPPTDDGKKVIHRGMEVHPFRGKSWVSYMGKGHSPLSTKFTSGGIYLDSDVVGWELGSKAALRQGKWKIVHLPMYYGGAGNVNNLSDTGEGWELFDVESDPGETQDLAAKHPEKLHELLDYWDEYVSATQIVWGPQALADGLPEEGNPHLYENTRALQLEWILAPPGTRPAALG